MSQERSLGLQWRIAIVFLLISLIQSLITASGYYLGRLAGLEPYSALGAGLAGGIVVGLAGTVLAYMMARPFKLRLWEAGRMAGRIARGDFQARIYSGHPDEVGWLEEQLNQMAGQLETAVKELENLAEQNRRLGEEAGRGAALEERARMARDLHDTVNQQLFVLAMRAAAARRRLEQSDHNVELLAAELSALEELAGQAHTQTRELILQLRPVTLEQQGLGAALTEYVNNLSAGKSWSVNLNLDTSIALKGSVGENLFRIAQEALNNIIKHASAANVDISLNRTTEGVVLRIADDGEGFDVKKSRKPTAVGIPGIRERVETMGGSFQVKSSPSKGTEIVVVVEETGEANGRVEDDQDSVG